MKLWPFSRTKSTTSATGLPEEVQNYYAASQRERTGLAWLLAAGTLVVTVLVVVGLFQGGRWLYHKAHTAKAPTKVAQNQTKPSTGTVPTQSTSGGSGTPAPSGSTPNNPSNAPSQPAQPTSNSDKAAGNDKLATTGPGNVVAIFVLTSIVAALGYQEVLRRRA